MSLPKHTPRLIRSARRISTSLSPSSPIGAGTPWRRREEGTRSRKLPWAEDLARGERRSWRAQQEKLIRPRNAHEAVVNFLQQCREEKWDAAIYSFYDMIQNNCALDEELLAQVLRAYVNSGSGLDPELLVTH